MPTSANLQTYADLIIKNYADPFVDAVTKSSFVIDRLNARNRVKPGKGKIVWRARYGTNSSAGSMAETDSFSGAGNQSFKEVSLDWKIAKVEIAVGLLTSALSGVGGMTNDPMREEVDGGILDLQDVINTMLMGDGAGNSNKDITGVKAALSDSNAYAGLARGTYTWWKPAVNTNAGVPRALSRDLIRSTKRAVEARGGKVTEIWCGSNQWDSYCDLYDAAWRNSNTTTLEAGWEAAKFEGTLIVKVPGYDQTRMDFLDLDLWDYQMLPVKPENSQLAGLGDLYTNIGNIAGKPGFGVMVWTENLMLKAALLHFAQLRCRNPYKQGSLVDLTPSG